MNRIAAIVVTYNRKDYLLNCLEAIRRQTLPPDVIYIIDNHSSDGTSDILYENHYIVDKIPELVREDFISTSQITSLYDDTIIFIQYIYKFENTGGAGGFYTGMKTAYEDGYEWLWMMDDDGIPSENGVEQLLLYSCKYGLKFANALVINVNNRYTLSFYLERNKLSLSDYENKDVVYDKITPFNGSFINREVPEKIGFIKKEMFIWGDEMEYFHRSMYNKFSVGTVVKSIHYHPANKEIAVNIFPFINRFKVVTRLGKFANIYYRNIGFVYYTYNRIKFYRILVSYLLYFFIRLKFCDFKSFLSSYMEGSKDRFGN